MTVREAAVAAEIRRLAREDLGLEAEVADDEELAGRLDSLALLSLVVAVEDRFRIRLGEEDAAAIRSLSELAGFVAARSEEPVAEASP